MFIAYETDKFSFFWKPHGIPSTFGKEKSFLDFFLPNFVPPEKEGRPEGWEVCLQFQKYFDPSLQLVSDLPQIIKNQISAFGKDKEY